MTPLPERPHPGVCTCAECQLWASTIVAIPVARKRPEPEKVTDEQLATFAARMMSMACKATGLTEEQLRAKAEAIGTEFPKPVRERVSREAVAARGVPERHLEAVYDAEPIACDALTAVQNWLASDRTILCLSGGVGLRKTGSACWALSQRAGRYVKASRLPALATSVLDDERAAYSLLFRCQVLVLDDLGREYTDDKGFFAKIFNELLDERYERKLKTILTTNLTWAEFKTTYGVRATSRMKESSRWVSLGGEDVRGAAAK